MTVRFTQADLRAINEALAARLAGEIDSGIPPEDYQSAKEKTEARIHWKAGE